MAFLAQQCGYGVDVVRAGAPFTPPETVIDDAAYVSTSAAAAAGAAGAAGAGAGAGADGAAGGSDELAISTAGPHTPLTFQGGGCGECVRVHWYIISKWSG